VYQTEYKSKLTSAADAVELIPARGTLSIGMAVSEPPALLSAPEDRVKAGKGATSRIVPKIEGPTTDPRTDTQYVVTEYGVACMIGKSTAQRAEALIAIAHPEFREGLRLGARQLGYL
jgi:acyl-CoA hydrolase